MVPRVSVCVMSFNHAPYIADCLQSALAQADDVDLEILVGDDCSTDSTRAIVASLATRYPETIRPFFHVDRLGATGNYRFLVSRARGELIAHLDGDDFWLPGKLLRQVGVLDRDPDVSGVFTNAIVLSREGICRGVFNAGIPSRLTLADIVRRGNRLNNSSCIYRRSLAGEVLRPERNLLDYDVQLVLARHGDLAHIDSTLVGYRWSSESSMLSNLNAEVREMYWCALSGVRASEVPPGVIARGMAVFLRSVFYRSLSTRDPGLFRCWWRRVHEAAPVSLLELATLTCIEILRVAYRLMIERVAELSGPRPRVFYQ